jgi:hypothetical protein
MDLSNRERLFSRGFHLMDRLLSDGREVPFASITYSREPSPISSIFIQILASN